MKSKKRPLGAKLFAAIFAVILCFASMGVFVGCSTPDREVTTPLPPIQPPASLPKVHSVVITYNDTAVEGVLQTDISKQTLKLGATVKKDDGASGTLVFASSNNGVAEIDAVGNATLLAAGETVITASFGTEKASIVLDVEGGDAGKYSVTVNGGLSNVSAASAGDIVTVTPVIPEHKEFSEWIYTDSETPVEWISGNMFKMPNGNVTVKANFINLYTIRLVGGKVTNDGNAVVKTGKIVGYDGEKSNETMITEYEYPKDTELSFSAAEPNMHSMFIGWDKNTKNNRIDEESDVDGFTVPEETTVFYAKYSAIKNKKVFDAPVKGFDCIKISGGLKDSDPVLEGFSGYTVNIPGGTKAMTDPLPNNVNQTTLTSIDWNNTSQAIRTIFRNRGDKPVTVEVYVWQNGCTATSGWVTIPAGEVVVKTFISGLGVKDPYGGFAVREDVGEGSTVPLDIVMGSADAYPDGDIDLAMDEGTVAAEFSGFTDLMGGSRTPTYRGKGWVAIDQKERKLTVPYVYSGEFTNLPELDENDPYVTVYVRFKNYSDLHSYTYRLALSEGNPVKSSGGIVMNDGVAYKDITFTEKDQTELVALRVPRKEGAKYRFSIIKLGWSTEDGTKPNDETTCHNYGALITYNNGLGFEGDIVEPAKTEVIE